jgi:hypothetical protein
MEKPARLFNCARCKRQVIICTLCDRGNVYCGLICSRRSRMQNHRIANQKYQNSLKGRLKHAQRQRRYRQRLKEKVTDQGSFDLPPNDLLSSKPKGERKVQPVGLMYCHFCGKPCLLFLRTDLLGSSKEGQRHYSSWPLGP